MFASSSCACKINLKVSSLLFLLKYQFLSVILLDEFGIFSFVKVHIERKFLKFKIPSSLKVYEGIHEVHISVDSQLILH